MKQGSEEWGEILLERIKFFGAVFLCLFIDCLFLMAWLSVHWALSKGEHWFAPVGVEKLTSIILRAILETPTFVLVLIFIAVDIKKISLRIFQGAAKDIAQRKVQIDANDAIHLGNEQAK